jgi:hypothetical protein
VALDHKVAKQRQDDESKQSIENVYKNLCCFLFESWAENVAHGIILAPLTGICGEDLRLRILLRRPSGLAFGKSKKAIVAFL